jgi:hypothetical protein
MSDAVNEHLRGIFDSPEYLAVEREQHLWKLRGDVIDAYAQFTSGGKRSSSGARFQALSALADREARQ